MCRARRKDDRSAPGIASVICRTIATRRGFPHECSTTTPNGFGAVRGCGSSSVRKRPEPSRVAGRFCVWGAGQPRVARHLRGRIRTGF